VSRASLLLIAATQCCVAFSLTSGRFRQGEQLPIFYGFRQRLASWLWLMPLLWKLNLWVRKTLYVNRNFLRTRAVLLHPFLLIS
jgi:hypothetical protein